MTTMIGDDWKYPTAEEIRELLHYDPQTGIFRWRKSRGGVKAGSVAGSRYPNGYIGLRLNGRRIMAHRVAWVYVKGVWPRNDIDHENRKTDDNRIKNLREATESQNMANTLPPKTNTSGSKGVSFDRKNQKWMAYIQVNGKFKNLGRYTSKEEAAAVYATKARETFGEFARV